MAAEEQGRIPVGTDAAPTATAGAGEGAAAAAGAATAATARTGAERYPSTFRTGEPQSVHHSYIWLMPLNAALIGTVCVALTGIQNFYELYQGLSYLGIDLSIGLFVIVCLVLCAVLIYVVALGLNSWSYKHLSFRFDEREFSLYSGIFSKKRVHVPYARVQSVNHKAGVLQRIFGVCTIMVDTAGGAGNKEVRIPYVELGVGERIRSELFARKAATLAAGPVELVYCDPALVGGAAAATDGAPVAAAAAGAPVAPGATASVADGVPVAPGSASDAAAGAAAHAEGNVLDQAAAGVVDWRGAFGGVHMGMEPASYEFGLTNGELFLSCASHSGTVAMSVIAAIFGLFSVATFGKLGVLLIPLVLAFLLAGWLAGMIPVVLSYGGFKARRRGSRIEVERGLLQHQFSGIDVDRVQSVVIKQSLIRRLMGCCEVSLGRIDAQSDDGSGNSAQLNAGGLVVHPFVKIDRVEELLNGLLPEFQGYPRRADLTKQPRVALRRGLVRRCLWFNPGVYIALTALLCQALFVAFMVPALDGDFSPSQALVVQDMVMRGFGVCYLLCAVGTVLAVVGTVLWHRESGFGFNESFACLFNSGLSTEYVLVPRKKLQFVYTRTNPFQRMAYTASINMVTAAGTGNTRTCLWDIRMEHASAWLLWSEPGGNRRINQPGL